MTGQAGSKSPPRTPKIDEVLRSIGRNLLLFQHIEHPLKQLMTTSQFEGTVTSMQANFEECRTKFHKRTLGQLAGQLVNARNDLIHHFLLRWSSACRDSSEAALAYLDEQRTEALPIRARLQGFVNTLQDAARAHARYVALPDGARDFESMRLRHSRMVLMLASGTVTHCSENEATPIAAPVGRGTADRDQPPRARKAAALRETDDRAGLTKAATRLSS